MLLRDDCLAFLCRSNRAGMEVLRSTFQTVPLEDIDKGSEAYVRRSKADRKIDLERFTEEVKELRMAGQKRLQQTATAYLDLPNPASKSFKKEVANLYKNHISTILPSSCLQEVADTGASAVEEGESRGPTQCGRGETRGGLATAGGTTQV